MAEGNPTDELGSLDSIVATNPTEPESTQQAPSLQNAPSIQIASSATSGLAGEPPPRTTPGRLARGLMSCERCRKIKCKCDDHTPCKQCQIRGEECVRYSRESVLAANRRNGWLRRQRKRALTDEVNDEPNVPPHQMSAFCADPSWAQGPLHPAMGQQMSSPLWAQGPSHPAMAEQMSGPLWAQGPSHPAMAEQMSGPSWPQGLSHTTMGQQMSGPSWPQGPSHPAMGQQMPGLISAGDPNSGPGARVDSLPHQQEQLISLLMESSYIVATHALVHLRQTKSVASTIRAYLNDNPRSAQYEVNHRPRMAVAPNPYLDLPPMVQAVAPTNQPPLLPPRITDDAPILPHPARILPSTGTPIAPAPARVLPSTSMPTLGHGSFENSDNFDDFSNLDNFENLEDLGLNTLDLPEGGDHGFQGL